MDAVPAHYKTEEETRNSLTDYMGLGKTPLAVYSDNAGEISKAVRKLGSCSATATPHIPQTNGAAENSVRCVTEGTACALTQSGFSYQWWNSAMRTYCMLRNITDVQHHGTTPYFKRYGIQFTGHRIPFGAEVGY